jgi:hypothetical protein
MLDSRPIHDSRILADHSSDLKEIKQIVGGHAEAIVELRSASHTH